jgi:hypothetical protein
VRTHGRSSTRQWNDILGIIRQQGAALDVAYLTQWADVLGVRDLLEQALVEVGLTLSLRYHLRSCIKKGITTFC